MIREAATAILSAPLILRPLRARALQARPLTILCYHTLGPDRGGIDGWTVRRVSEFRADVDYMAQHYEIVDLDAALDDPTGGDRPRAVITFDDGDRGLADHLPGVLDATSVPVTIYVATAQFETRTPFWFDRVVNAHQGAGEVDVPGLGRWTLPGGGGKAQWAALRAILAALKTAAPEDRDRLADAVAAQGTPPGDRALGPMGRDDLARLAAMPGVTIGAHSHGHELLDQIPLEAARDSVARSRELMQAWTGQAVRHFAFPNGNHTSALRDMVRDLGFASATILEEHTAPTGTDPFALPRISVGRYDSPARVRLRTVGL